MFNISNAEWKIAHQKLDKAPDGTKLPYSFFYDKNNQLVPRSRFKPPKTYQTTHSFIKVNKKIYALAPGKKAGSFIDGSMGRVKYAACENGTTVLIKISWDYYYAESETTILNDLSLSFGTNKRIDKPKFYTVMTCLGKSLDQYINHSTSDEKRLEIAIDLCWQVHRMHTGLASKTQTAYAHMDLKPDNVTIDEQGHVHLIDFGLSLKFPKKTGGITSGAEMYVAYCKDGQSLTREQIDLVALKRVLFMPSSLYGKCGYLSPISDTIRKNSILTKTHLSKLKLTKFIDTFAVEQAFPDYSKETLSAVTLCALLIAAKLNLNIEQDRIKNDTSVALCIAALYFHHQSNDIAAILTNENLIKLVAALDEFDQFDIYKDDTALLNVLNQAKTHDEACALVQLKKMQLENYYSTIIKSPLLAKIVVALGREKLKNDIESALNNESAAFPKAILFLDKYYLSKYYHEIINDFALRDALADINNLETEHAIADLMQSDKIFSNANIIMACKTESIIQAIHILKASEDPALDIHANSYYFHLFDSPDVADAIVHLHKARVNFSDIIRIILSLKKCKAINIAFKAGFTAEEIKSLVATNESTAVFIILLDSLNMSHLSRMALNDHDFSFSASRILRFSYKNAITPAMLTNKQIRDLLSEIGDSPEKFKGFLVLYAAGLLNRETCINIKSAKSSLYLFEAASLLKEKSLERYLVFLVKNPEIAYHVYLLLSDNLEIISRTYHLAEAFRHIPREARLGFMMDTCCAEHLKEMHKEIAYWNRIKALLTPEDKASLKKMIYTEEELNSKAILKKIKHSIKKTTWSYGLLDAPVIMTMGSTAVSVPPGVDKQVAELNSVATHQHSPIDALNEIKKIGRQEAINRQGTMANMKYLLFNKSSTDNYFDQFENEETFRNAFS